MEDRTNKKTIKLCNCNGSMSFDAAALGKALGSGAPLEVHTALCRKQAGAFQQSLNDPDVVVACTQEASLFSEIAEQAQSDAKLRFVNVREVAGRSAERDKVTPKIAALLAAAALPEPEPVPSVDYKSAGQLLIIGPSAVSLDWARRLSDGSVGQLSVNVLMTRREGGELPAERDYPVWAGKFVSVSGYLGAFDVEWSKANPIDLDICTRCNACIEVCPEGAIDFLYQIDPERCKNHRKCVDACGQIGAISFEHVNFEREELDKAVLTKAALTKAVLTRTRQSEKNASIWCLIYRLSRLFDSQIYRRAMQRQVMIRSNRRLRRHDWRRWSANSKNRVLRVIGIASARTAVPVAAAATVASMFARPARFEAMRNG